MEQPEEIANAKKLSGDKITTSYEANMLGGTSRLNQKDYADKSIHELFIFVETQFKCKQEQESLVIYYARIAEAINLLVIIAKDNFNKMPVLEKIYQIIKKSLTDNGSLAVELANGWEGFGLKLCAISPIFVNLFPKINGERTKWSLLDLLQYEIIRFYYSDPAHDESKDQDRLQLARRAMNFLLKHRLDNVDSMKKALSSENFHPLLMSSFFQTIELFEGAQSNPWPMPSRENKCFIHFTSRILARLHNEEDMLTVGCKPNGLVGGRLKVKRIRRTPGKPSEVDKYLNLWLEKDFSDREERDKYLEPVSGNIAHALHSNGAPKARLLKKASSSLFQHSSINKFQNNLILAKDILTHPLYRKNDVAGKLFGLPVTGLIGMLIISSWFLKNSDLHVKNFGVVIEKDHVRFFFFDFDKCQMKGQNNGLLIQALNTGDINLFKKVLRSYIEKDVIELDEKDRIYFQELFKNIINSYGDDQIIHEIKILMSDRNIFSDPETKPEKTFLQEKYQLYIHEKLSVLKVAIENFVRIVKPNQSFGTRFTS